MSAASAAASLTDIPVVLLNLFLTRLTPMFRAASCSADPAPARAIAVELLKAFGVRDALQLFDCTQIMGFGMTALDSLDRSMQEGVSTAMLVRLRGTAATMHRASQQSRRALEAGRTAMSGAARPVHPSWQAPFDPHAAQAEAEVGLAGIERLLAAMRTPAEAAPADAAPPLRAHPQPAWSAPEPPDAPSPISDAARGGAAVEAAAGSAFAPFEAAAATAIAAAMEAASGSPVAVADPAATGCAAQVASVPSPSAAGSGPPAGLCAAQPVAPLRPAVITSQNVAAAPTACQAMPPQPIAQAAEPATAPRTTPSARRGGSARTNAAAGAASAPAAAAHQAALHAADRQRREVWAGAMIEVAKELTEAMPGKPMEEQRLDALRISALTSAAGDLINGAPPPAPFRLPLPFG